MSLIKKPSELQFATLIKELIYGQPGIGKTTLALSAPAPLLIDCDKGAHRINPIHLKDTVQVTSWEDIDKVLNEDLSAYQTLIIDTAGKMIELMTDFIIRNDPRMRQGDGSLALKGYGARKVMFKNLFSRVSMLGKNIIFVAHELEERDGDNRFVRPEIGGSSGNDLMKELDLVGYVQAIGKKRSISFDATEKYYGKNTCNLPERMEFQDVSKGDNSMMSAIFSTYAGMLAEKGAMRVNYNKLLDDIEARIENINTLDDLNKKKAELMGLNHIWDSRVQSAKRLANKAKEMDFVFDRESGVYVIPPPSAETATQGSVEQTEQHSPTIQDTLEVPTGMPDCGLVGTGLEEVGVLPMLQPDCDAVAPRRRPAPRRRVPPIAEIPEQQNPNEY